MALQPMYPGKINSPQTELASAIDDEQTTIPLLDASVLPDPPNLATIGTGENAETVLYTGISGNDLTGVTRGFQGVAKAWSVGAKVARYFTAYDHDAFIENINTHASRHAAGGPDEITPEMIGAETPAGAQAKVDAHASATTGVHGATSAATPNTLVQRDPAGRFKAAAPVEVDDVARKAEVDAHVAALVSDPDGVHGLQVETGTWTPYVAGITTPGSHTYAQQSGYYSRIGKLIKIDATVIVSSKDVGWAGDVYIGGLPYPAKLDAWKYISFSVSRFDNVNFGSSAEQITAGMEAGIASEVSRIRFYKINSGGAVSNLDAADITGTAFRIHVSGVYDIS